jgi:hypothetical protein
MKKSLVLILALMCTPLLFAAMPKTANSGVPKVEICDNKIDDDDDKLVDCEDPDCKCEPSKGTPCSPGYWKNHKAAFDQYCQAAADLPGDQFTTCAQLYTAITCKGSDASCGRHAASSALNQVSGCTED